MADAESKPISNADSEHIGESSTLLTHVSTDRRTLASSERVVAENAHPRHATTFCANG